MFCKPWCCHPTIQYWKRYPNSSLIAIVFANKRLADFIFGLVCQIETYKISSHIYFEQSASSSRSHLVPLVRSLDLGISDNVRLAPNLYFAYLSPNLLQVIMRIWFASLGVRFIFLQLTVLLKWAYSLNNSFWWFILDFNGIANWYLS